MIGEIVGKYRITGQLGEGGMSVVWAAVDEGLGRPVVIKMLHHQLAVQEAFVSRLKNEARAAARIRHPGIVVVYEIDQHTDRNWYIAMERLQGEPLARRLDRDGKLPEATAVLLTRQVATALSAAHAEEIVHRDLTPDNIFLVPDTDVPGGERDLGLVRAIQDRGRAGGSDRAER